MCSYDFRKIGEKINFSSQRFHNPNSKKQYVLFSECFDIEKSDYEINIDNNIEKMMSLAKQETMTAINNLRVDAKKLYPNKIMSEFADENRAISSWNAPKTNFEEYDSEEDF